MIRLHALVATAAASVLFGVTPDAGAAPTPLPADPAAHGYVGLCDEQGRNVIGGNIDTKPFIWKAVASQPPPSNYQGPGQNAVLNIYQPRPNVLPADWSGQALTAASFYRGRQHPAVQATYADLSLKQFTSAFPAEVDGLYVLRIFYGKMNYGLYSATYPTAVIQVTGQRWRLIQGGNVDCRAASGVSNEQLTGVVSKKDLVPRKPAAALVVAGSTRLGSTHPNRTATSPAGPGSSTARTSATSASAGGSLKTAAAQDGSRSSTGTNWLPWGLLAVAVVLGAGSFAWQRRRGGVPPPGQSAEPPATRSDVPLPR